MTSTQTPSQLAIVFPGQGSQAVGMLAEIAAAHSLVKACFDEASEALGENLWTLSQQGPEDELNKTEITQPAMLAAGVALWRLWREQGGPKPAICAGHSLGEYTALVAAGRMDFANAALLVRERGRLMQNAVPAGVGAMAAVLGLDDDKVRELCQAYAEQEILEAVNYNSPGQVVVAGHKKAVERLVAVAKEAGAKRALLLAVSVPSHSSLMKTAAEELAQRLAETAIQVADFPVLHNCDVKIAESSEQVRASLAAQVHKPVMWVDTVKAMAAQGTELIVELGPGKVLTGLNKRIEKKMTAAASSSLAEFEKALELSHVER